MKSLSWDLGVSQFNEMPTYNSNIIAVISKVWSHLPISKFFYGYIKPNKIWIKLNEIIV